MNSNSPHSKPKTNTSIQEGQRHCYGVLLATEISTGQQQNLDTTDNNMTRKKKKSHGNRKEQHRRRKLRRKQQKLDNSTVDHSKQDILLELIESDHDMKHNQEEEQIQVNQNSQDSVGVKNKRKRSQVSRHDSHVSRSFSQLSISQKNTKKTKSAVEKHLPDNERLNSVYTHGHNKQHENQHEDVPKKYRSQFKPRYLTVPDNIFKEMLSNSIEDGDQIIPCVNTKEKLQFVRQMTETTNNLYYFDLQCQFWQDYCNIALKENKWISTVSKSFARKHHTCRTYGFPKEVVEEKLKSFIEQRQHMVYELQEYLIRLEQNSKDWQPYINPIMLSVAINECVNSGQKRLREKFDYKRKILIFDSTDRKLIAKFYELLPTVEQTQLARNIWDTTAKLLKTIEQEEVLRKRIHLRRLPSTFDQMINQPMEYVESMLSSEALDKDNRACLVSSYSKTITQYKFDFMSLNLDTLQSMIRGHKKKIRRFTQAVTKMLRRISNSSHRRSSTGHGKTSRPISSTKIEVFFRRSSDNIERVKPFPRCRSKISIYTKIAASLPFIEVDLNLTSEEMSMLINGLKYIIPCQRHFSRKMTQERINEQYQRLSAIIKNCLQDHRIPTVDQCAKVAFQALSAAIGEINSKKLPKRLGKHAKHEYKIMQSIQRHIRQRSDIVIRRTDKSKVFYIGKANDFQRQAAEYMLKTQAYEEIQSGRCPLSNILHAVQTLLKSLVAQKALTVQQSKKLSPKLNQLELGHYHGLPKPHKVTIVRRTE
ncbi:unnamed protein product [Rotaria sp. Silwood2]|nr:unnamed protein product [Rotaria sp. Silwood2]